MSTPSYEIPVYTRGDLVQSTMSFYADAAETTPADPTTVTATVLRGDGLETTYTYGAVDGVVVKSAVGVYYVQCDTTPANGEWVVRWAGTGTVQKAYEDVWMVTSVV